MINITPQTIPCITRLMINLHLRQTILCTARLMINITPQTNYPMYNKADDMHTATSMSLGTRETNLHHTLSKLTSEVSQFTDIFQNTLLCKLDGQWRHSCQTVNLVLPSRNYIPLILFNIYMRILSVIAV